MNYLAERRALNQYCVLAVETLEHLKTINQPATEREGNRWISVWYLASGSTARWQYQSAISWDLC
jgi:hypothetical protein